MELAEQKVKKEAEEDKEKEKEKTQIAEQKTKKKLAFHAKPPTVEITSPDMPHQGAFHDSAPSKEPKEPKVVESLAEEEDDDQPTFSDDMNEARQQIQKEIIATETEEIEKGSEDVVRAEVQEVQEKVAQDVASQEGVYQESAYQESAYQQEEAAYDPNAYPGYIWNYETQEWEYDPNYVAPEGAYDQNGYEGQAAAAQYDQNATTAAYSQEHAGYDQDTSYPAQTYDAQTYPAQTYPSQTYDAQTYDAQAYTTQAPGYDYYPDQSYQAAADPSQEYDYSAYGGYEGYLAACKAYDEANGQQQYDPNVSYSQGYGYEQEGYYQGAVGAPDDAQPETEVAPVETSVESQNQDQDQDLNQNPYAAYGDSYQGYDDYNQSYPEQEYQSQVPQMEPLFKQAPPPSDPYGWDSSHEASLPEAPEAPEVSTPKHQAPVRPPPARPEAPKKTGEENEEKEEEEAETAAPPRPPPAATRPPPPRPAPAKKEEQPKEPEPEEDAWAQFKRMTEKVNSVVKNTESTLKTLEETSAANDIKDESYLANIGGSQGMVNESTQKEIQRLTEEKKMQKMQKKKLKQQGKKAASPTFDPDEEDAMDRAAQELAMKMAAMRTDLEDWKAPEMIPIKEKEVRKPLEVERKDSASAIPPRKRSSIKDVQQDSGGSLELPPHLSVQNQESNAPNPKGDLAPDDPILTAPAWADFESSEPMLPPSESGFFSNKDTSNEGGGGASNTSETTDPFGKVASNTSKRASFAEDPFAPQQAALIDESYDPFAVVAVEEVVAMAKAKAEQAAANAENDEDFYNERHSPALSTPTPEGGSPISQRPNAFEDDFKCADLAGLDTPTPLYDEDDSQPLADFIPRYEGDGWDLMVRHPIKKKSFMAERCWKPCYVRLHGTTLYVYNEKKDTHPIQELLLQATYSLSDTTLQAYDVYGKIHTVKLQYVVYKEKVGIRPGQISRLVDGHITKYGLPLEHSAQCTVLLKFGSLNASHLQSFVSSVEDLLFKCKITRTQKPLYKQDEVQIHCYDEYSAFVDKEGVLSDQKARVRLFCLAFLSGSPCLEVGLNDRRRQGKEIVRRKDILPMYTERWIRFEALEFHSIVNKPEFDKEQVISFSPPDGCFFEVNANALYG
uniref:SHD domain-containing protein n=1 Tax=Caenorhabditis japonica TaxID=281687 RepID=A0A8R1HRU0_CAEJA